MAPKADYIWIDGRNVKFEDAKLPFLTHTFHYGLGVFEGIRAYRTADGTAIFRLREHMTRLQESAHICRMELPVSVDALCDAAVQILRANKQDSAYLRPVAWYGDEAMGLGASNPVHVGIASFPWGSYLGEEGMRRGIRAKISSFPRRAVQGVPVKAKINGAYVASILAKKEAQAGGYDEAILLDANGMVCEATGENLFMVKGGVLWTPPESAAILTGITRATILQLARDLRLPVREELFTRDMLYLADECFLTGTAAEVTPVREVDDRRIGSGSRGPVTGELQDTFFRAVKGEDPKYAGWLTPVR